MYYQVNHRLDGMTTFPWKHGKCLVRDATVVDAFSKSHIIASYIESGSTAKTAEILKSRKYQGLVGNFHFQPVARQQTAAVSQPAALLKGRKLFEASEDPLEAVLLCQKVSLAIVRGNATSIFFCLHFPFSFF